MTAIANSPFVHDADVQWLYIVGRVKPGVNLPALQQKLTALLRQSFEHTKTFSDSEGKKALAIAHVVLTPGGGGIQAIQQDAASSFYMLMTISGAGAADCLRERCQSAAGAWHGAKGGDVAAHGAWVRPVEESSGNC